MKQTPLPPRRAWIRRRTKPHPGGTPRTRKKRSATEFQRIYHSRARLRWIKSLPCVWCAALSWFIGEVTRGHCHNAHTENGGMGRKAGYETIVPLCASHHRRYDEHQKPFDDPVVREAIKAAARATQAAWERYAA